MISNIIEINKLTIFLAIIVLVLVFMLMKRLNIILNRTTNNNVIYNKDKFSNTSSSNSNSNTSSSTSNTNTRYNEITYGMNPECVKSNVASNAKFCPNAHPNIPCSLVENCGASNPHLTDEMKRDIYMYVYLTGLLESTDIFNAERDDYWYNHKINTTTTNSN